MSWDTITDNVKSAMLTAIRHYDATVPEEFVRWEQENEYAGSDVQCELSFVSVEDVHQTPRLLQDTSGPSDISTEVSQLHNITVQVKVSSVDLSYNKIALVAVQRLRLGLYTRDAQAALDENPGLISLGPLRQFKTVQDMRSELQWIFEANFRAATYFADPTDQDTVDTVIVDTCVDTNQDGAYDITSQFEVP